ncbi:MAG: AAA family ATPase [Myxococcales bacterium]|nr:AAA family ATPase [Myxococcales bacterium]
MARKPAPPAMPISPEGYSWPEVHALVRVALRAEVAVLMRGHPGVGKSALAKTLAGELGLTLIDIRLAQRDPADLVGVYFPSADRSRLVQIPPDWALLARETPCLVFLDEINAAVTRLHQAAAYQIVLERRVGDVHFHPGTRVLAAGNLEEDNAIVSTLSSALCNRFAHFILKVDAECWQKWALKENVHPDILAFIGAYQNEVLYKNTGDVAFPSPRSWEMASRVYSLADPLDRKRLVAACVGLEFAEKLENYVRIFQMVNAEKIIRKGERIDFLATKNRDPSFVYAAVFAVGTWIFKETSLEDAALPNIVTFLRSRGLDAEYQFLLLRYLRSHDPRVLVRLRALPAFRELAADLVGARTEGVG